MFNLVKILIFLFGICLNQHCTGYSKSLTKCGSVFLTVSSMKGSFLELNWNNNCERNENYPITVALYNTDIRNKSKEEIILYKEIKTNNHLDGYYKTELPFNISEIPDDWKYDSNIISKNGSQSLPYWIVSFSNLNKIIDIQSLKIQPTWMYDNRDKLRPYKIGTLLIPGTHDSGCYGGLRIMEDYVLTQDMTVWNQLVFGIRYLDLRIAYHQDEMFWINHDFVRVKKVQLIFEQIKEFIKRSPGEIIIIDFHRFPFPSIWPKNLHKKFINYTINELGKYAYSKIGQVNAKGPTLEQMWNSKKNIIFTYGEKRYTDEFPQLWEPIPQVWADTIDVNLLKQYLESSLYNNSTSRFNALMAELTPRVIDVFTGINTLRQLANDVNPKLTKWVRDEWRRKVNIITSDFFLGNNLIDVAIDININR